MKGSKIAGSGKEISILVFSEKEYTSRIKDLLSSASSRYSRICYVSINKPYSALSESLKKGGADTGKLFFIDCTGKSGEKAGQVVYVSSPKALTEMSITIGKVLELGKIDALVFDSLSTLLVYQDPSTVVKFAHSLISMLRSKSSGGFLICLQGSSSSGMIKDISMFADRVVGGKA